MIRVCSLSLLTLASAVVYARPFAYVAVGSVGGRSGVAVIDLATNTVIATLPVRSPTDVFAAPGGRRLFALAFFGGTVSLVGTATNGLLASVAVSGLGTPRETKYLAFFSSAWQCLGQPPRRQDRAGLSPMSLT